MEREGETTIEVNSTFKTPEGTVKFQGELSQDEADFVIQVGLNFLMQQGALPFKTIGEDEWANMPTPNDSNADEH